MARDWARIQVLRGDLCLDAMIPRQLARAGISNDVLRPINGQIRWPEHVPVELRRAKGKVPGIGDVLALGTEVELTDEQQLRADSLRLEDLTEAEARDLRTQNEGEAQCVILCEDRGWPLITHDDGGKRWAAKRGVEVFSIVDLLIVLAADGHMKPSKAWRAYQRMCRPVGHPDPDKAGMFFVPGWSPESEVDRDRFYAEVDALAAATPPVVEASSPPSYEPDTVS